MKLISAYTLTAIIAAMSTGLQACSGADDDGRATEGSNSGSIIGIPMLFNGIMEWQEMSITRSGDANYTQSTSRSNQWASDQLVYFTKKSDIADSEAGSSETTDYYSPYIYSGGQLVSQDPLVWKQYKEDVCAFYRGDMGRLGTTLKEGNERVRLNDNFSVKVDQSSDANYQASDFVFFRGYVEFDHGTTTWTNDGRIIDAQFYHKVAQLRVNVFCTDTEYDPANVTQVKIGNQHFGIEATVKSQAAYYDTPDYTDHATQQLLTVIKNGDDYVQESTLIMNRDGEYTDATKGKYVQYRVFIIPQTIGNDIASTEGYISRFIEIKYNNVWYYYTINNHTAATVMANLKQGTYYTFNITLKPRTGDSSSTYNN